jgi:hypothetical protein
MAEGANTAEGARESLAPLDRSQGAERAERGRSGGGRGAPKGPATTDKAYLVVEGHSEDEAARNLVTHLWANLGPHLEPRPHPSS